MSHPKPRSAPAAERNKDPIFGVLRRILPETGLVLEIASGTGQHVVHFAQALPKLTWQPSDPDPEMRASIAAWVERTARPNVRPPLAFDVREDEWPVERADAVLCINMVHISPWEATLGLMRGVGLLKAAGVLALYGPYKALEGILRPATRCSTGNSAVRTHSGLRELETVEDAARRQRLTLEEVVEMPSNNLTLVFRPMGSA